MQFKFKVFNFFERIDELLMLNNVGFEGPPLPPSVRSGARLFDDDECAMLFI
jgi:hypothetical protein